MRVSFSKEQLDISLEKERIQLATAASQSHRI